MPGEYDPRRYGASTKGTVSELLPTWPAGGAVLGGTSTRQKKHLASASSLRRGSRGVGRPSLIPTQVLAYEHPSDVQLSLPNEVLEALAGRGDVLAAERCYCSRGQEAPAIGSPRPPDEVHTDHFGFTSTAGLLTTGLARGRTRRRSLSWHCRERLPASASCTPRQSCDAGFRACSEAGAGRGRGRGRVRAVRKAGIEAEGKRGESIDAEQLFRRKKKLTYNVTYVGWAESYDRSMAKRALLERKERLEMEREGDLRRRRAEEEFQKWLWNHTRSASASTRSAGKGVASLERKERSEESGNAEAREVGRGDLRSALHQSAPISWKETVLKRKDGRDEEDDDGDTRVGGKNTSGSQAIIARGKSDPETDEVKRREIDGAFRKWLDRKKKQAQSEREAQNRKEELREKDRKLEASRRWKKRPVVCAYTYGAQLGARQWSQEEEEVTRVPAVHTTTA